MIRRKHPFAQLYDNRGIALKSGERFLFSCCDCGLVHTAILVTESGEEIGLAVARNRRETTKRRLDLRRRNKLGFAPTK